MGSYQWRGDNFWMQRGEIVEQVYAGAETRRHACWVVKTM